MHQQGYFHRDLKPGNVVGFCGGMKMVLLVNVPALQCLVDVAFEIVDLFEIYFKVSMPVDRLKI